MNNNIEIEAINKAISRVAEVAFVMGKENVDRYTAMYKINKIIDEVCAEFEKTTATTTSTGPKSTADMMDKIAQDPSRFIRGVTILDRYPRVEDRDAFTIIKTEPVDKYTERVYGVIFETYSDGTPKCIYVTGNKNPSGTYVCGKKYFQVEIPTWVRS